MSLLKDLNEHTKELKEFFDREDADGTIEAGWSELIRAVSLELKPRADLSFFHRLGAHLEELHEMLTGERLDHSELLLHLMRAFLSGPLVLVTEDIKTEIAQGRVLEKLEQGSELTAEDSEKLLAGLVNLHASALYSLSYRYLYRHFDQLSAGLEIKAPDDLSLFPVSADLIDIAVELDVLYRGPALTELRDMLRAVAEGDDRAQEAAFKTRLAKAVGDSEEYRRYRRQSVKLIKTAMGPAATGFLIRALKSIPGVDDYYLLAMREAGGADVPAPRYVQLLREAPAYVRVIVYASEANDEGHFIEGAHIPFAVASSERVGKWGDTMLEDLFDDAAGENPFYSSRRARLFAEHPVNVDAEYKADIARS